MYSNAFYLMINSAATAGLGFVFWGLMARIFSPEAVGIGSALLSAGGLISSLANLGLGAGLVRFVPEAEDKARHLVIILLVATGVAAAIGSVAYLAGASTWSPALVFVSRDLRFYLGFVGINAATSVSILLDSSFVARRSSGYTMWKGIIANLIRIPLPGLLFLALGGYGMYVGNGLAVGLSVIIGFVFFIPKVYPRSAVGNKVALEYLRQVFGFSFVNCLAGIFSSSIAYIFPLMVLSLQGAQMNAFFYIAWMISTVLSIVPGGLSMSLFAEVAHDPKGLTSHLKRALWLCLALLIPAVLVIYILAPWLLALFGQSYATHGAYVLRWLLVGNFPFALNSFYSVVNQIRKKMCLIVAQSLATSALVLTLAYWLLQRDGLAGIGIAYTVANLIVASAVAVPLWKAINESGGTLHEAKDQEMAISNNLHGKRFFCRSKM